MRGLSAVIVLFNLYTEQMMRSAWLDVLQAVIKIGRRNINMGGTTPMAKSIEELEPLAEGEGGE